MSDKKVNIGYLSRISQDVAAGGSGSGGGNTFPMTYDENFEKLLDASGTEVTYAALLAAAQAGKLCYIYVTVTIDGAFYIDYLAKIKTEPDTAGNYIAIFSELGTGVSAMHFRAATTSDVLEWYEA